jgi:hypothetical protein
MTKTDADCLRLLPDRRLGSFYRLGDLHDGCPCFRMGFELPQILFGPRIANGGLLFRHGLHCSLGRIDVAIVGARVEAIRLRYHILRWTKRKIIHIDIGAFCGLVEPSQDERMESDGAPLGLAGRRVRTTLMHEDPGGERSTGCSARPWRSGFSRLVLN